MRTARFAVAFVFFIVVVPMLHAATYIVPSDRELVRLSPAIARGTVIDSYCRRGSEGMIETVTRVAVDEWLKGTTADASIDVVQYGGVMGNEWMVQSGAPAFIPGDRVLLFLDRNKDGDWTTWGLALGAFHFGRETDGTPIVERTSEITGWDVAERPYRERRRLERPFLDYIRSVAAGAEIAATYTEPQALVAPLPRFVPRSEATYSSGTYSFLLGGDPARRKDTNLSVAWRLIGTQPNVDMAAAVDWGDSKWNAQSPKIDYSRSNTPASGDTKGADGEQRVIAGDPHGDGASGDCCPGVVATAWSYCSGAGCTNFTFNGVQFLAITENDVVSNDGTFNISQSTYNAAMTHEFGHTLGLRHSNQNADGSSPCQPGGVSPAFIPQQCTSTAIMNSSVNGNTTTLQQYDKDAIDCLYDAQCDAGGVCTPPSISTQPSNKTIFAGASTTLSVTASGTAPFTYQWYIGNSGDTSNPVSPGGTSSSVTVSPNSNTSYWVRVTGNCAPTTVDSNAALVTVNPCPDDIAFTSATATNTNGSTWRLSAAATSAATPLTYKWFRGDTPGVGGVLVSSSATTNQTVTVPTNFWAQATNACGNVGFSTLVSVTPACPTPQITTQPADVTIPQGGTTQLTVGFTPADATVTWYEATAPTKLNVVGTGATLNVGPLTGSTQYWANISNSCGEAHSRTALVTVQGAVCTPPAITVQPVDQTIASGATATLSLTATGTTPTITWYLGVAPDKTTAVGSGTSFTTGPLTATTTFWAAVTNSCGEADSATVTITVPAACEPPAITAVTPDATVPHGQTATLTVTATGTAPLHYQWYIGASGDTSMPVGFDSPALTTPPLNSTEEYWVQVTNDCGFVSSNTVTLRVLGHGRRRSVRH